MVAGGLFCLLRFAVAFVADLVVLRLTSLCCGLCWWLFDFAGVWCYVLVVFCGCAGCFVCRYVFVGWFAFCCLEFGFMVFTLASCGLIVFCCMWFVCLFGLCICWWDVLIVLSF